MLILAFLEEQSMESALMTRPLLRVLYPPSVIRYVEFTPLKVAIKVTASLSLITPHATTSKLTLKMACYSPVKQGCN